MTPATTSTRVARARSARGRLPATLALALVASWAPPQPTQDDVLGRAVLEQVEDRVVAAAQRAIAATVGLKIREFRSEGDGSGVIVTPQGHVLTVAHNFTEPGTPIEVHFSDGSRARATALGRNERGDYAVVKLDGEGPWPHVEIGDSDALQRHQLCVMTGHAGGIVEGRPPVLRVGTFTRRHRGYWLKSECAMMPGDSGGALFDLDGNVVGINSYIEEDVDANFHVPTSIFGGSWDRLVAGESWNWTRDSRRRSRVRFEEGGALGLELSSSANGVEVQRVIQAYGADEAGVRAGDRVLKVRGDEVHSVADFWDELRSGRKGESVALELERDGERLQIEVPYTEYEREAL